MQRHSSSTVRLIGRIAVETRDLAGNLIPHECGVTDNIVVTVGMAEFAAIVNGEAEVEGWEVGVGTSNTTPVVGNTDLGVRVHRAAITSKSRSGAALTWKLYIDTSTANGYTLVEAGLFHDRILIDHGLITAVAKTASKTTTISITITFA